MLILELLQKCDASEKEAAYSWLQRDLGKGPTKVGYKLWCTTVNGCACQPKEILAIKALREATGGFLKECKDQVMERHIYLPTDMGDYQIEALVHEMKKAGFKMMKDL